MNNNNDQLLQKIDSLFQVIQDKIDDIPRLVVEELRKRDCPSCCRDHPTSNSECSGGNCEVNGGWGEWSNWSRCGASCEKSRSRECNKPSSSSGGSNCTSSSQEVAECFEEDCETGKVLINFRTLLFQRTTLCQFQLW